MFPFTFTVKCSKYDSMLHVAAVISLHSSTEKTALSDSGAYRLVEYLAIGSRKTQILKYHDSDLAYFFINAIDIIIIQNAIFILDFT